MTKRVSHERSQHVGSLSPWSPVVAGGCLSDDRCTNTDANVHRSINADADADINVHTDTGALADADRSAAINAHASGHLDRDADVRVDSAQ